MGRVNETISNVNSAMRNLLLLILIGGAGIGGYKAYDLYNAPQKQLAERDKELAEQKTKLDTAYKDLSTEQKKNSDLSAKNTQLSSENDRLQVAMKLLKVRHRLARLTVLEQKEAPSLNAVVPDTGTQANPSPTNLMTRVQFVEVNEEGQPIGEPKEFPIRGDMVYVDYLTVNFEDKYIEKSDLDRNTSLALFQRIFGEHQEPVQGFQIDTVGTRPTAYARGKNMSDFEKKIWNDFWLIANDRKRAKEMGIDAIQGKAVAIRVQPGMTYEIDLRATGEMAIRPLETKAPPMAEAKTGS
jgi:hypothetical protein